MINERLMVSLLTFMHLWVCFLPIIKHCFHSHAYLCLFCRLMILLLTFMHIRVFSYDWWYCSWLLCRFAKSAVAPNARARSLSQLQHIQHFQEKRKRKMHIDFWTSCHKIICFNWPFMYSSCCPAYKEIYARRKLWKPFASCKHEVPSGAAGTYHILQYLETDLISAGLHLSALIHSQIIYISWALPLSMLTAPHLSFSLLSTQYCPASSYFQLNIF